MVVAGTKLGVNATGGGLEVLKVDEQMSGPGEQSATPLLFKSRNHWCETPSPGLGVMVTESPATTVMIGFGVVEEFQAAMKPRSVNPRIVPWA